MRAGPPRSSSRCTSATSIAVAASAGRWSSASSTTREAGAAEIAASEGAGNESVGRTMGDETGRRAQGTGPTSSAAEANAEELLEKGGREDIGEAMGPVHKGSPNP